MREVWDARGKRRGPPAFLTHLLSAPAISRASSYLWENSRFRCSYFLARKVRKHDCECSSYKQLWHHPDIIWSYPKQWYTIANPIVNSELIRPKTKSAKQVRSKLSNEEYQFNVLFSCSQMFTETEAIVTPTQHLSDFNVPCFWWKRLLQRSFGLQHPVGFVLFELEKTEQC